MYATSQYNEIQNKTTQTPLMKVIYLIKISNDFVEEPEALQSFFVDVRFGVELFKVRDGSEHDTHQVIGLVVQILQDKKRQNADVSFRQLYNSVIILIN